MLARPWPSSAVQQAIVTGLLLAGLVSASHAAERRIALVIGNSAYTNAPLYNPGNDARAVADVLREDGFSVTEKRNLSQSGMRRAIRIPGDDGLGRPQFVDAVSRPIGIRSQGRRCLDLPPHRARVRQGKAENSGQIGDRGDP